jgi:hypothetical protein
MFIHLLIHPSGGIIIAVVIIVDLELGQKSFFKERHERERTFFRL